VSRPEYQIVVPSRGRAHNMETIRYLLPSSLIAIDERDVEAYAPFVEGSRRLIHPPIDGLPGTINWIMDTVKAPCLVEIDDDFQGIQVNVGSRRFITDASEILAIIENAMTCCHDLGLTAFCWSRTMNTTIIHPDRRPIVPTQSVCNAFGLMGAARHRHYDTALLGRADVDWTLRTLLEDRAVYADVRFYFDCGRVFAGRGGNVGLVTPEIFKNSTRQIVERWGKAVSFKTLPFQKNRNTSAVRIAVSRTNKTAQR
jgi:hypothetical protein